MHAWMPRISRFPAIGRRVRGRASPREISMHPAFATRSGTAVPIWFVTDATWPALRQAFDAPVRSFADASGFEPKPTQCLLLPGAGGLSGVLFGATILAAATSLPEVSTGLTSVRHADYQLAMSDIFGGNAFLPVLFLLAGLLSGSAVLPQAQATDIYLTALGIVLTVVYLWGLVTRPHRQVWRMGIDSLAVLLLYAAGIAGLIAVSNS